MPLEIRYAEKEKNMADFYEVEERLCLTEDGRAVPESDPDARWFLAGPGDRLPMEEAEKYGLSKPKAAPKKKAAAKKAAKK